MRRCRRRTREKVPEIAHKAELTEQSRVVLARGRGWGEKWRENGQGAQACSCEMNMSWRSKAQHGDYS